MEIVVCVGSSCHLKGSHKIISRLESLIKENDMSEKVTLKASFCMGNCTQGVSATLNGKPVNYLTINNVEEFFYENMKEETGQ